MTNFIPIFPLSIVVFPGEQVNLHIFEPRYRQLIHECFDARKQFGIPVVIKNELQEMGTLMEVVDVKKVYEDGKMDVTVQGLKVFRVLEQIRAIPEKLYGGAIVTYPDAVNDGNRLLMQKIVAGVKEMHRLLHITKDFKKSEEALNCFDIAHHAGLNQEEEYELLGIPRELQRQEYLKRHLGKVLPVLSEMENLKERVKMNGHFRNLKPFEFDF